ncbi:transcriptional regulator [Streptomyces sp. CB02009]|nr:transcriptional regulator [Streptomyces sp. CB02009]
MAHGYEQVDAPGPGFNGLGHCAELDPELFFPERVNSVSTHDAKATCAGCPVRQACMNWALDNGEEYGVWGGLDERERRALRRARTA